MRQVNLTGKCLLQPESRHGCKTLPPLYSNNDLYVRLGLSHREWWLFRRTV